MCSGQKAPIEIPAKRAKFSMSLSNDHWVASSRLFHMMRSCSPNSVSVSTSAAQGHIDRPASW